MAEKSTNRSWPSGLRCGALLVSYLLAAAAIATFGFSIANDLVSGSLLIVYAAFLVIGLCGLGAVFAIAGLVFSLIGDERRSFGRIASDVTVAIWSIVFVVGFLMAEQWGI